MSLLGELTSQCVSSRPSTLLKLYFFRLILMKLVLKNARSRDYKVAGDNFEYLH